MILRSTIVRQLDAVTKPSRLFLMCVLRTSYYPVSQGNKAIGGRICGCWQKPFLGGTVPSLWLFAAAFLELSNHCSELLGCLSDSH